MNNHITLENIENTILEKVKAILNIQEVSIEDNVFMLEADSLQVIRLASELSNCYGINIKINIFIKYLTLAEVAKYIYDELNRDSFSI